MSKIFVLLLLCSLAFPMHSHAQETHSRIALVIGNSAYQSVPNLRNPSNDASDIAVALEDLGFDVSLHLDVDDVQMRGAIRDFAKKSVSADLSIVYFAGHGIEIDKKNFLLPIDAELQSEGDAELEAIQLKYLVRAVSAGNGVTLVLVDACRSNPFAERLMDAGSARSIGQGLVRVEMVGGVLPGGVLISYAAREGTFAFDGIGRNSPYAQGFLEQLEEPGLEVSKLFRKVRDRVFVLTEGQQEPFTYGSLPGSDIFLKAPVDEALLSTDERGFVKDYVRAEDLDTQGGWESFLKAHPSRADHELMRVARRRLDVLRGLPFARAASPKGGDWFQPVNKPEASGAIDLNLEERKLVQRSLTFLGLDVGPIDGVFGPATRRAITAARLQLGLIPGSEVDVELMRVLPNAIAIDGLRQRALRSFEEEEILALQEPRLEAAIRALGKREASFDYHEGRLYFVVLGSAHDFGFARGNALARAMGGHLASVGDSDEDAFIFGLIRLSPRLSEARLHAQTQVAAESWPVLIGLHRTVESTGRLTEWVWSTGEPSTYTNWARGAVGSGASDDLVAAYFPRWAYGQQNSVEWRSTSGSTNRFAIEIE